LILDYNRNRLPKITPQSIHITENKSKVAHTALFPLFDSQSLYFRLENDTFHPSRWRSPTSEVVAAQIKNKSANSAFIRKVPILQLFIKWQYCNYS